jgi:hypothetical protein
MVQTSISGLLGAQNVPNCHNSGSERCELPLWFALIA